MTTSVSLAQESGTWRLASGQLISRPCLKLEKYGELTPLPGGCIALLEDGGILYTKSADAGVSADIGLCNRRISMQKEAVLKMGAIISDLKSKHVIEIKRLATACDTCATELARRPAYGTLITTAVSAFALGAAVVSILVVL